MRDEKAEEILRQKVYKSKELCYPVNEADSRFVMKFTFVRPARTNGKDVFSDDSFNVGRGYVGLKTQEEFANMYGDSKVDLISVFGVGL